LQPDYLDEIVHERESSTVAIAVRESREARAGTENDEMWTEITDGLNLLSSSVKVFVNRHSRMTPSTPNTLALSCGRSWRVAGSCQRRDKTD
jgi:hypothetical protein